MRKEKPHFSLQAHYKPADYCHSQAEAIIIDKNSFERKNAETGGEAWREIVPGTWMRREPSDI